MQTMLETERLRLRELEEGDLPALRRILRDPVTMRAYEGAFDEAEVLDWLRNQQRRYREEGRGLWAVLLKDGGEMIGQCGLTYQSWGERRVLEVGYLFERAFWHRGYATEAARACRDYAFDRLGAQEVFSIIRDSNFASQAVARRNGMTLRGDLSSITAAWTCPIWCSPSGGRSGTEKPARRWLAAVRCTYGPMIRRICRK